MMVRPLRVAVIAVIACWMAGVSAQQPQQQQAPRDTSARPPNSTTTTPTARLSGRVIASESGKPIKRARVFITAADVPSGRGMLTDDNGVYEFTELPAGRYTINASKSGYIQLSYGQRRPLQAGTPLQLLDGQQLRNIDFALPKGGVIAGRVADETGDVMPGVAVQVLRYQSQQGERRAVATGQAQTDDRGVYRIWGLNPGNYYVSALPRQDGFSGRGPANAGGGGRGGRGGRGDGGGRGGGAPAGDDQDQLMYAPTYYPGVPSIAEARAVTLGVSQELVDIDFSQS